MRTAVKFAPLRLIWAAPLLLIAACYSQADQSTVTNSVIDNTVGTASDEMTNIDATIGSAANMAADVPAGASSDSTDGAAAGGDAGSGDAAQRDTTPVKKPAPKPTPKAKAPKLDSAPGDLTN
jgi:hypothetical protein